MSALAWMRIDCGSLLIIVLALGTSKVTLDFSGGRKSLKYVLTGNLGENSPVNVNY